MTGDGDRLDEIERGCERLDRDEYNQGVPNHAPWRTYPSRSGTDRWVIYQPTGSDQSRIITEGVGQPFADFIAAAREDVPWLIGELRDARAENERLRLNSDAATVAMTGQLYSDVESTAQQLHELGEQRAAKQIRMVLAQVRVAQRVASEFEQMVAELAAERAKVQRVEALCDERDAAELRQYPFSEAGGWVNTKRIRRALAGGEQGE